MVPNNEGQPSKCIAIGFKLFSKNSKTDKYIPLAKKSFAPFDPCLTIDGQPIRYIINPQEKDPFKAEHFKFLGRCTCPLLKEKDIQIKLQLCLKEDLQLIEDSKVNCLMKLWLYQLELQRNTNQQLNEWATSVVCLTMDYFSVNNRPLDWVLL